MRKITANAIDSLYKGQNFNSGNTKVIVKENVSILTLHNNPIAYLYNNPERTLSVTNAGWKSNTTKERLNALPNVRIHQKNFIWYLNGKEWDGKLIDID